jgi:hypothetical protein
MLLFEAASERKYQEMKFNAILHGANPKEIEQKTEEVNRKQDLLFGDPKEYESWSDEEKKRISQKMKSKFMKWAKGK